MSLIYICNQKKIERFNPDEIRAAVTESNYHTLCNQYGLDPALIEPAKAHLDIRVATETDVPFFMLHYSLGIDAPLVVTRWREPNRLADLLRNCQSIAPESAREQIARSQEVFTVELSREQCHDMGLLFAYELARWAAFKGEGVVCALDGLWYRLNAHKAFLPII